MNNETLNNIKVQLEEDYIDFGIHDKEEIELLITMVKTYENWKVLKEWLIETFMLDIQLVADNSKMKRVLDKINELESGIND